MTAEQHRARIRRAITAQLGRRRMSLAELQDELEHFSPRAVKTELRNLVGVGIVCSRETPAKTDEFETWDRALKRLREKRGGRPPDTVKPRARMARRIA